jgi:hypothetical protein
MTEQELMDRIKREWGSMISNACHSSSVPEAFIAALIANESGGNPRKIAFEPRVYGHLMDVREGRAIRYGATRKEHLIDLEDEAIVLLATSRGLTQIMSYNAVYQHIDPLTLSDPGVCLTLTLHLLASVAECYWLDERTEFEPMFRCWNSGRPDGATADPHYVENGLARMKLYQL